MCTVAPPFYAEEDVWPLVHSLVPAALYISTRDLKLSLLLIFAFEFVERIFSYYFGALQEQPDDMVISDPFIGAAAIAVFWFIDQSTHADVAFLEAVSLRTRVLAFVIIGTVSPVAICCSSSTVYWGVLVFYALYVITGLAIFHRVVFRAYDPTARVAGQSVLLWLALAGVWTLLALPITDGQPSVWLSTWSRAAYVALALNAIAVWVYATKDMRVGGVFIESH